MWTVDTILLQTLCRQCGLSQSDRIPTWGICMYLLDLAGMGWTGNSLDSFAAILCYVWLSPGEDTWKHSMTQWLRNFGTAGCEAQSFALESLSLVFRCSATASLIVMCYSKYLKNRGSCIPQAWKVSTNQLERSREPLHAIINSIEVLEQSKSCNVSSFVRIRTVPETSTSEKPQGIHEYLLCAVSFR